MKLCTHQKNKWQIICLHIVSGGYFCQHRSPKKYHTQHLADERKLGTETRGEKKKKKPRQCQETRGLFCCSMFICFSSQFGRRQGFFNGGRRGSVCDLECVQTPGLSPRPLLPRPAGYLAVKDGQITAKTEGLTDRKPDRQRDECSGRRTKADSSVCSSMRDFYVLYRKSCILT